MSAPKAVASETDIEDADGVGSGYGRSGGVHFIT
jgi:hypothetical protein